MWIVGNVVREKGEKAEVKPVARRLKNILQKKCDFLKKLS